MYFLTVRHYLHDMKIILLFLILLCGISSTIAQENNRTQWFKEARFGLFIHWGLYSAAEGLWKGEKLRYANNYAEWIRYRNRISKEEYGTLAKRFVWDKIDPEKWVLLAKEAGMKYIIMTSKHHDGVAIWDTQIGDYSLSKLSGQNRDILKELADACRKHNMKLGFYYSHWIDWEHPYAWDHNQELTGRVTDEQFNQYWQEKVIPQLTELLTNYGDVALMWFDMWIPYEKTILKKEQLEQVVTLIRRLQPDCLINSRLGLPTDEKNVDFQTFGDNQLGTTYVSHPWETPGTIAHSWGYNGQENEWKSTSQIFESLISNVSLNGGLTLNIGPRADGTVPYESISRLQEIGGWLEKHGQSIYGATGLSLRADQHDWGYLTTKSDGNKTLVYAQVFNWPLDNTLRISGITSVPKQIQIGAGEVGNKLKFEQSSGLIHIHLPDQQTNPYVSCIQLEFEGSLQLDKDMVAESTFGGFALTPQNNLNTDIQTTKHTNKKPAYAVLDSASKLTWQVYIPEAGVYTFDISAHNPNDRSINIRIGTLEKSVTRSLKKNGKTVAEPNENNYVEEFTEQCVGEIEFCKSGTYRIYLSTEGNLPLWLNWIWIDKKECRL